MLRLAARIRARISVSIVVFAVVMSAVSAMDPQFSLAPTVTQQQRYTTAVNTQPSRALESQSYPNSSPFLSVRNADKLGLTAPMRVRLVWEAVDSTDVAAGRQCSDRGANVTVECATSPVTGCAYMCTAGDVIAPADVKYVRFKAVMAAAVTFVGKSLRLKPVLDNIVINSTITTSYALGVSSVASADLVVVMTARPADSSALDWQASCLQRDQYSRCTVGRVNWIPSDMPADSSPYTAQHVAYAVQQLYRLMGAVSPGPHFIDANGTPLTTPVYTTTPTLSADYPKPITFITTPRVAALAKSHFDCSSVPGLPLEDATGAMGAFWKGRAVGPEVMAFEQGTGEPYVSDFTLAFLEDTGQYVANYSAAGALVPGSASASMSVGALMFTSTTPYVDKSVNTSASNGKPRWGAGAGCGFLYDSGWNWEPRYRCSSNSAATCSSDNRMISQCSIVTGLSAPQYFACGDFTGNQPRCSSTVVNDNCNGFGQCSLPSMYQYYSSDSEAIGASGAPSALKTSTGGSFPSMDFVPVSLSVWNCADAWPSVENATALTPTQQRFHANANVGGQANCPNCRCFQSNLREWTRGVFVRTAATTPSCYRANCYKSDYLQVGIKAVIGPKTYWYKCPSQGGNLAIAGFTGEFHCPRAVDFCAHEKITGIRYPETIVWLEWFVWSALAGLPLLALLVFASCRSLRESTVRCCKRSCGVTHFALLANIDPRSRLLAIRAAIEVAQDVLNRPASARPRQCCRRSSRYKVPGLFPTNHLLVHSLQSFKSLAEAFRTQSRPSPDALQEARRVSLLLKAKAATVGSSSPGFALPKSRRASVRVAHGGRRVNLTQKSSRVVPVGSKSDKPSTPTFLQPKSSVGVMLDPTRGQHPGWQHIRSLCWLPNGTGHMRFRADLLKAIVAVKGRRKSALISSAQKQAMASSRWRTGCITMNSPQDARPVGIIAGVFLAFAITALVLACLGLSNSAVGAYPAVVGTSVYVLVGVMGVFGAVKRAEVASCHMVTFFVVVTVSIIALAIATLWWLKFPTYTRANLEYNWDTVVAVIPFAVNTHAPVSAQVNSFVSSVNSGSSIESLVLYTTAILLISSFSAAFRFLRHHIACSILHAVSCNCLMIASAGMLVIGVLFMLRPVACGNDTLVPKLLTGLACTMFVSSLLSRVAVFRNHTILVKVAMALTVFTVGWSLTVAFQVLTVRANVPVVLGALSATELATYARLLGYPDMTEPEVVSRLQDTLQYVFTLALVVALLSTVAFLSSFSILKSIHAVARLLTLEGVVEAKAAARTLMVVRAIKNGEHYDTGLINAKLKSRTTDLWATLRSAAWVVGRHAVRQQKELTRAKTPGDMDDGYDDDGLARSSSSVSMTGRSKLSASTNPVHRARANAVASSGQEYGIGSGRLPHHTRSVGSSAVSEATASGSMGSRRPRMHVNTSAANDVASDEDTVTPLSLAHSPATLPDGRSPARTGVKVHKPVRHIVSVTPAALEAALEAPIDVRSPKSVRISEPVDASSHQYESSRVSSTSSRKSGGRVRAATRPRQES